MESALCVRHSRQNSKHEPSGAADHTDTIHKGKYIRPHSTAKSALDGTRKFVLKPIFNLLTACIWNDRAWNLETAGPYCDSQLFQPFGETRWVIDHRLDVWVRDFIKVPLVLRLQNHGVVTVSSSCIGPGHIYNA